MSFRALRSPVAVLAIVVIVAPTTLLAQKVAERPIDAAQVMTAIDHGVAYLKSQQGPRGEWSELPNYDGGVTALCTLALINSGVPITDPVVSKGINALRGLQLEKTYTVSLQTMVLCAAEPKKDLLVIRRNVKWLEEHQIKDGQRKGAWSYPGPGGDNSNSQFAVLALFDAQRVGIDVSRDTWELAANYWRSTQNADGSWGYVPGDSGTGSMTCAGIGGLAISTAALESGDAAVENGKVQCCRPHEADDKLDRAVEWLATHFSVNHNPRPSGGGQACLYYYLYGL
jgi:prenyltransferase beta subunit